MPRLYDDQLPPAGALSELRKTGIEALGNMPWGTHFCHFYGTKQDLVDILVPFFKAGLENGEFCIWVLCNLLDKAEAIAVLSEALPSLPRHIAAGDIEILPYTEWYAQDGTFEMARVIKGWDEKLNQALAKGYGGMRVSGDGGWLTEKDSEKFEKYE